MLNNQNQPFQNSKKIICNFHFGQIKTIACRVFFRKLSREVHKTFNVSKMEWQVFCVSCRTIWCNFSTTFPFVLWDTVDRHKFWFLRIQCLNCWRWYESQKNYPHLAHWIEIVLLIKMKSRTIPFAWLKLAFFGNSGNPSIHFGPKRAWVMIEFDYLARTRILNYRLYLYH